MYKTLVPSYLRPGLEPYRSIAAGSYDHCLAAALRHGPGAEVRPFRGGGDTTLVSGYCGQIETTRTVYPGA